MLSFLTSLNCRLWCSKLVLDTCSLYTRHLLCRKTTQVKQKEAVVHNFHTLQLSTATDRCFIISASTQIEYQDVYVVKRISGSHHSSIGEANAVLAAAGERYVLRHPEENYSPEHVASHGTRSVASTHSSGPKQVSDAERR